MTDYMGRIDEIVRACSKDIGYEQDKFHHETVEITNLLHEQSAHIAQGVDASADKDEGAGDQGIMFGFATRETDAFKPAPIHYSHAILRRLIEVRKDRTKPRLGLMPSHNFLFSTAKIEKAILATMSLTPRGIREHLGLNRPIYQRTAMCGHFGRSSEAHGRFSWERTDRVNALKAAV
jgi:S-adenosylmethionine synthetase